MPDRQKGQIVKWLDGKGFGFIKPDEPQPNGKDIWVHSREILVDSGKFISIAVGAEVEFIVKPVSGEDLVQAAEVTAPGGGPLKNQHSGGRPPRSRTPPRRRQDDSRSRSRSRDRSRSLRRRGDDRDRPGGRMPEARAPDPCKLFVGQLSYDATEEDLRDAFSKFGELVQVQVIIDRETRKCKGFGFVKYEKPEIADEAMKKMDGTEITGRICKIDRAAGNKTATTSGRDARQGGEPEKLFIGRLERDVTESDVKEKLGEVGEIVSVQIIKDHDSGESKGFGFVRFAKASDADEALKTMDGCEIKGAPCRLQPVAPNNKGKGKGRDRSGGRGGRSRSRRPRQRRGGSDSRSVTPQRPLPRRGPAEDSRRDYRGDRDRAEAPRRRDYRDEPPPRRRDDYRDDYPPPRRRDDPRDDYRRRGDSRVARRDPYRDEVPPRRGRREEEEDEERPGPARGGRRGGSWPRGGGRRRGDSPSPDIPGVPKRSEAVRAARAEFEDACHSFRRSQGKVDSAQANLRKVEKTARQEVARAVAEADKAAKTKLAEQLERSRKSAEVALDDTLQEVRSNLERELKDKIRELKKEYEQKIIEDQTDLKDEHAKRMDESAKRLREAAETRIEAARRQAEEDSRLTEFQEAVEKATALAEKEEEKMQGARKKLENLLGEAVEMPRSRRGAAARGDPREDEDEEEDDDPRDTRRGRGGPEREDDDPRDIRRGRGGPEREDDDPRDTRRGRGGPQREDDDPRGARRGRGGPEHEDDDPRGARRGRGGQPTRPAARQRCEGEGSYEEESEEEVLIQSDEDL